MTIVFITADISGIHIQSHKLPITPIYDLFKEEGYDCAWAAWNPWGSPLEGRNIPENEVDCYVTGDVGIPSHEKRQRSFFHPHGLHPMEKGYATNDWYGYLSPGSYWVNHYAEDTLTHGNLPITGWAKFDILSRLTKEEVISDYTLNLPYEKTILYAPTGNWDWATSFAGSIEHILNHFKSAEYNLVIKNSVYSSSLENYDKMIDFFAAGHPSHINRVGGDQLEGGSNIDLTPLYKIADLVITDGSSVAWEGISLDIPTIQLNNMPDPLSALVPGRRECEHCNPHSGYHGGDNLYHTHPLCKYCAGPIKIPPEMIGSHIQTIFDDEPPEWREERLKWSKLINAYTDGKCAERCVQAIKRIAGI